MRWPWLTLTLIAGYLWWCWRTLFSPKQLQFLDDELAAFFKGHPKVLLQPWRIEGDLEAFDRDLLAY